MSTLPVEQRQSTQVWPYIAAVAVMGASTVLMMIKEPGLQRGMVGLTYLGLLALMAVQDIRTLHVSNQLVYGSLALAVGGSLILGTDATREALLGGAAAFGVMFVVALLSRGAMGWGDVKVGAFAGMIVGLHGVVLMVFATFAAGGVLAAVFMILRLRKRKDVIAFIPFLVAGTLLPMWYSHLYLWS